MLLFSYSACSSSSGAFTPLPEEDECRKQNAHARDNEKSYDFCDANIKNSHSSLSKNISQGFISVRDDSGAGGWVGWEALGVFIAQRSDTEKFVSQNERQLFLVAAAVSSRYRQSGLDDAVTKYYAKCETAPDVHKSKLCCCWWAGMPSECCKYLAKEGWQIGIAPEGRCILCMFVSGSELFSCVNVYKVVKSNIHLDFVIRKRKEVPYKSQIWSAIFSAVPGLNTRCLITRVDCMKRENVTEDLFVEINLSWRLVKARGCLFIKRRWRYQNIFISCSSSNVKVSSRIGYLNFRVGFHSIWEDFDGRNRRPQGGEIQVQINLEWIPQRRKKVEKSFSAHFQSSPTCSTGAPWTTTKAKDF